MNQAIRSVGSEIIQFQTVTDNGSGTFTLSNLLRGLPGHGLGDRHARLRASASSCCRPVC